MDPAEATASTSAPRSSSRAAADALADALEATFERDPDLYYEDGYQELVDRGGEIDVGADRRRSTGSRSTTTTTWPGRGRSRAATNPDACSTPLLIDVRRGRGRRPRRAARRPADLRRRATSRSRSARARASGSRELIRPTLRRRRRLHRRRRHPRRRRRAAAPSCAAHVRRGRRHRRRQDHRRRPSTPRTRRGIPMVAVATNLAHDGIARRSAIADARRRQGLLRRAHADRGGRRPRLRPRARPDRLRPGRHRRRGQQPSARSPTGSWPAGCAASRSTGWPSPWPGPAPRRCSTTPATSSRRRLPHRPGRGADLSAAWRWRSAGTSPAVQRRLPRDPARHRPALPGHRHRTASRPASGALFCTYLRGDEAPVRADRRLPAPARAARLPGRPRPDRRPVRRGGAFAPRTRPGRYTILEHLDLSPDRDRGERLADYADAVRDQLG